MIRNRGNKGIPYRDFNKLGFTILDMRFLDQVSQAIVWLLYCYEGQNMDNLSEILSISWACKLHIGSI